MNQSEIKKLKIGDEVLWPDGANQAKEAHGFVAQGPNGLMIIWDDEQRTSLTDKTAMKFVKKSPGNSAG